MTFTWIKASKQDFLVFKILYKNITNIVYYNFVNFIKVLYLVLKTVHLILKRIVFHLQFHSTKFVVGIKSEFWVSLDLLSRPPNPSLSKQVVAPLLYAALMWIWSPRLMHLSALSFCDILTLQYFFWLHPAFSLQSKHSFPFYFVPGFSHMLCFCVVFPSKTNILHMLLLPFLHDEFCLNYVSPFTSSTLDFIDHTLLLPDILITIS